MNEVIRRMWPVEVEGRSLGYDDLAAEARGWLERSGVPVLAFSHFGIVVRDVASALDDLASRADPAWAGVEAVWGEAFGCRIARRIQDGTEYEIIEPVRGSFLRAFLEEHGAGLQHLSFEVADLALSLERLRAVGVPMADPEVRRGLHGMIAFVSPGRPRRDLECPDLTPGLLGGRCLELCRVTSGHD